MTENKSLFDLGIEYERASALVKERIEEKRRRLRSLRNSVCSNEAFVLKSELNTLYREYREAKDTAEYLKNYYCEDSLVAWGGVFC